MRESVEMTVYKIQETAGRGLGLFAAMDIREGERICCVDLRGLERYTPEELECLVAQHPELDGDHPNYVGHGKYIIDYSPASYMNHSCDPNCYFKMASIGVYDVFAVRDIAEGEDLTHDYTANAVDQFAGQGTWVMDCRCGSENCRKQVTGDFFEMPREWQVQFYPHLPPSVKRKYTKRFLKLFRDAE